MKRLRLELDLPAVYNEGDVTIITGVTTKEVTECVKEHLYVGMQNYVSATDGKGTYKNVTIIQASANNPPYYAEVKLK